MARASQRLEDVLLHLWDYHYQGMEIPYAPSKEDRDRVVEYLRVQWEIIDREPVENAIASVLQITLSEQTVQMAYQMVDFFRNDLGFKYD